MSIPTWDEYLSETSAYLSVARASLDTGSAIPDPPRHPDGAVPTDREGECRRLALGFAQLSAEVEVRMANLKERLAAMSRFTQEGRGVSYFVDTPL